jgi:hypothetical protein
VVDNKPQFPLKGKVGEIVKSMETRDFSTARHYKEKGIVIKVKKNEKKDEARKEDKDVEMKETIKEDIVVNSVSVKDDINNYVMENTDMPEDFGPII